MTDLAQTTLPPRLADACRGRLERARQVIQSAGVEALLVTHETDINYLTGFVGHDTVLVLTPDDTSIVCDTRYDEMLEPWRETGLAHVVMGIRHRLEHTVKDMLATAGRIGYQAEHLSVNAQHTMAGTLGQDRMEATTGLIGSLRMCKDDLEVEVIERAINCHHQALAEAIKHVEIGMTELAFCARLEFEMKMRGAAGPSFGTIIAAGPGSSVCHYEPGTVTIDEGLLLIDSGCRVDGYCSDITRTFAVGQMPPRMEEIYSIVLEAQLKAIDACRPGMTCASIDAIARDHIAAAGYGDAFIHGLGHGLGMDIHEAPYFNELQTDVELAPGMVMTVEPGIYIPGLGGVRIEDDVLITSDGHRVLSSYPKDMESMTIRLG